MQFCRPYRKAVVEFTKEISDLKAEIITLRAESITSKAESNILRAESNTLRAESNTLRAESDTLRAEMKALASDKEKDIMQLRIEKSEDVQAVTAEMNTSLREMMASPTTLICIPGTTIFL